jgi:nicotinamide mononucleotide (NMN) deamidase PncC
VDEETLHGNVARELERLNLTLSVVETVTGGNLSQKLTSTGSPSFVEGIVLPSEVSQRRFLDLSTKEFNTLSNAPAWFTDSLALMAKSEFKTDLGLALFSQIIEDQGKEAFGTETWYSLTTPSGMENQKYPLGGELAMVRERASIIGLDMVRKYLLKVDKS